jgi:hypothetical protein
MTLSITVSSVIKPNFILLNVAFFIDVLSVVMLSVIMLSVIMLSVVMLNVIMLSVVALLKRLGLPLIEHKLLK